MKLLRILGIDIRLNIFFMLLFIIYFYLGVLGQASIIFGVVFLHELGHVVVAKGYGVKVREVELLPFGGVARTEDSLELYPDVEIFVALAGPMTNAFLVLFGYLLSSLGMGNQRWLPFFIECNLLMGAFNLLPALPLDGGRILRAVLALRIGLKKATEIGVRLSKLISILMTLIGVTSVIFFGGANSNFLVIAIFLYYYTLKEKGAAMYIFMKFLAIKKAELAREGILLSRQIVAVESSFIKDVVKHFIPKKYHLVVVVGADHQVKGTLTEGEIINEMLANGRETPVGVLVERKK